VVPSSPAVIGVEVKDRYGNIVQGTRAELSTVIANTTLEPQDAWSQSLQSSSLRYSLSQSQLGSGATAVSLLSNVTGVFQVELTLPPQSFSDMLETK
jgi:hypothetical protein